ncbi:oligopeptide ABC transporter ATP-binding protein [Kaistia algarum]|uniref:ABC transporter ATP-binding protein n=1 Tax=Kaistia algarum TaxID=2083279 RepID=UPI000CE77D3C|nr:ATP-binding cassette domain-containing protein [Kaistia algarum]MCX5512550.1 ATP-binding cassette domain-containing protein [Kaistia algarum]PPE81923.1 oligopeptide ABC transporter ATP-binding protein [Kaistia algarum]
MMVPAPIHAAGPPLLALQDVSYSYRSRHSASLALDAVTFDIAPGETLAVIGESGSGKSTLARILAGLLPASAGRIVFHGAELGPTVAERSSDSLRQIQIVFQNPDGSLNPRHRIATILGRPLQRFFGLRGAALRDRIEALLADVLLPAHYADRYPSELSGGERQRVAVARALAAEPVLLICDEITSALDVSVQASLLALLKDIQARTSVSILFITHDLALTRWFADRAVVFLRGKLCENTQIPELYQRPRHPYTASLIEAVPRIGAWDIPPDASPSGVDPIETSGAPT